MRTIRTILIAALTTTATAAAGAPHAAHYFSFSVVTIAEPVRDSMNAVFLHSTLGWRKYPDINPINFGMGSPIWREAMRCLHGVTARDTLWITDWSTPHETRALASAVTGECDSAPDLVGTWHTHPWRADSLSRPVKIRGLSVGDLKAFDASADRIQIVQWDRDSLSAAGRGFNGAVHYPVPVTLDRGAY
jgi:hypothetical protein